MKNEEINEYKSTLEYSLSKKDYIEGISEKLDDSFKDIFLVGCGGSLMVMNPCKYICEVNSDLNIYEYNASEFYTVEPSFLSENSIVILSSLSGETDEVIKSFEYAKSIGATTIAFSSEDSTLGDNVDYLLPLLDQEGINDSQLIMLYQLIFSIINRNNNFNKYTEINDALSLLPDVLINIKEEAEQEAIKFANDFKDEKFFLVVGSGINWGEVYTFATCNLEEMQWIKAQPVHSGEFFHGTFEIINENTNIVIFKGEDKTRPIVDRVIEFSEKYSDNVVTIDTKDYQVPNVNDSIREYLSPFIISAVKGEFLKMLSKERNHPISKRRYMGKVNY
ncbi:MAG: SIS domain-containing protein [Bacillota bacterium]